MQDTTAASGMEGLRKVFALPAEAVRIDRFRCAPYKEVQLQSSVPQRRVYQIHKVVPNNEQSSV